MISYEPFDNICECGGEMHPVDELYPDNTVPGMTEKLVEIVFQCEDCMSIAKHTYRLPQLDDDVSKNVVHYLAEYVYEYIDLLDGDITLTMSKVERPGLAWALGDLQQKGVLTIIGERGDKYRVRLNILGWLLIWHGPY